MSLILIADDEKDLVELVEFHLLKEGHQVITAANGVEALARLANNPDAVILDWMMPKVDGMEVLRQMRERHEWYRIPVILLTARSAVDDRIRGLEMGADDYLSKPFTPKELVLRLKGVLRRASMGEAVLELGPFRLERESLRVECGGNRVDLTATEFKLMHTLMQNSGEVQTRERLLREVWGYKDSTLTRTLDTHVKRLREKLGAHADLIRTVRGTGYILTV